MDASRSPGNRWRVPSVGQVVRRRLPFPSIVVPLSISLLVAACGAEPAAEGPSSSPVTADPSTTDDESAPGSTDPESSSDPVVSAGFARCAEADFDMPVTVVAPAGDTGQEVGGAEVNALADAHPELFSGVWWHAATGTFAFGTPDPAAARELLEAELAGAPFGWSLADVPRSGTDLLALRDRGDALAARVAEAGVMIRVWDATLEVAVPILDEPSIAAIVDVFGDARDAICLVGGDPAESLPLDTPQPQAGDGWRLLADQPMRGEAYTTHAAVNQAEYEALWAALSLDGDRPEVDFSAEIVVEIGAVYGSSCPEIVLWDVTFDDGGVTLATEQLGGMRACTSDALPHTYLVAVERDALPATPFVVSGGWDLCGGCAPAQVDDLVGDDPAAPPLSRGDVAAILGAVAAQRFGVDNSFGGQAFSASLLVIDVLGGVDAEGFVTDDGEPLDEWARNAILAALPGVEVTFVSPDEAQRHQMAAMAGDGSEPADPVMQLAAPAVLDGRLTVTSSLWCGSLCAIGGAHVVERADDGTWAVTGTTGPTWIS